MQMINRVFLTKITPFPGTKRIPLDSIFCSVLFQQAPSPPIPSSFEFLNLEVNVGNYSRRIPPQTEGIHDKIEDIDCYYCRYWK